MGMERLCTAMLNGQQGEGKAHCGDGVVEFRGDIRFRWQWKDLDSVSAIDGTLTLAKGPDAAVLNLGEAAEKWAHAILHPKSRIDKFGLKPSHTYRAVGEFDAEFAPELCGRAGPPTEGTVDVLFIRLHAPSDLQKLAEGRDAIHRNGMVWAVWAKGRKEFGENDVRAFGLENGLVDVKVAKFNDELSALKLVIPTALR